MVSFRMQFDAIKFIRILPKNIARVPYTPYTPYILSIGWRELKHNASAESYVRIKLSSFTLKIGTVMFSFLRKQ